MNRLSKRENGTRAEIKAPQGASAVLFGGGKLVTAKAPVASVFGRGYGLARISPATSLHFASSLGSNLPQPYTRNFTSQTPAAPKKTESLEQIAKSLASLTDKEIDLIEEFEQSSIHKDIEAYLSKSKWQLKELPKDNPLNPNSYELSKKEGRIDIQVKFVSEETIGDDMEEGLEGEGEDEDAPVKTGDQLNESQLIPKRVSLLMILEFHDKDGGKKGTWELVGYAGHDNRLYVDHMFVEMGSTKRNFTFDDLSEPATDKLYDYLDTLGIDDQLSHFVRQYVVRAKSNEDIAFLKAFKSLIQP